MYIGEMVYIRSEFLTVGPVVWGSQLLVTSGIGRLKSRGEHTDT